MKRIIYEATPEAATDSTKLAATGVPFTDKKGYGARWVFSKRHVDNLLAQGLPHLKIGKRRVRIDIAEADAWMREKFRVQRRGPAQSKTEGAQR